jgi:hypothetical protein
MGESSMQNDFLIGHQQIFQPHTMFGDESPWGIGKHDLSRTILTVEQKKWVGEQVNSGACKPKQLEERLNLKLSTILKYAYCLRKRGYLCAAAGRPRCLDVISVETLKARTKPVLCSKRVHKESIQTEHVRTVARSYVRIDNFMVKRMSKRSMERYSTRVK